jgi:hypothetical protein
VNHFLSKSEEKAKDFWQTAMHQVEPSSSAFNLTGSRSTEYISGNESITWKGETLQKLVHVAKTLNVTLASVLRSVWAIIVAYYSRSNDVIFGEVFSGREIPLPGVER